MAKKAQNNTFADKLISKFNTIWGAIIAGCTLLGLGFAVGGYYKKIELDSKIRELENQKQFQIIECGEKNFALQKEIFELQKEVIDLKKEINNINDYRNEDKK